jgi:hypothetical protein
MDTKTWYSDVPNNCTSTVKLFYLKRGTVTYQTILPPKSSFFLSKTWYRDVPNNCTSKFKLFCCACCMYLAAVLYQIRHAHENKNGYRIAKVRLFDNSTDRKTIDYRFMAEGCHVCFVR